MASTTGLMTVEQYWQLPEPKGFYYELHHGELVRMSRPNLRHVLIQERLRELLKRILGATCFVGIEFPFRPLSEFDLRVADVACVLANRIAHADPDDTLHGAPEIVIEVLSPSNTISEINEKAALCLNTGALEFWVVDPRLREIRISTPDGLTRTYKPGESILLSLADNQLLSVDSVFADE